MSEQPDSNAVQSYLVRIWREADGNRRALRLSVTHLPEGARVGFSGVEELCAYLRAVAGNGSDGSEPRPSTGGPAFDQALKQPGD